MIVFHVTEAKRWQEAQRAGSYTGSTRDATLDEVGFAEVRVENLDGGDEAFPHVYGPIPVDAVVGVRDITP